MNRCKNIKSKKNLFSGKRTWLISPCIFISSLSLSGCLSAINEPEKYTLDPLTTQTVSVHTPEKPLTVRVNTPTMALSTQGMAYKLPYHKMSYYSHHEWWLPPNHLLQPLLLDTLKNWEGYKVVDETSLAKTERILDTQLIDFYADYSNLSSPQFQETLQVNWINTLNRKILTTYTLHVSEPMGEATPQSEAAAAQKATKRILEEIVHHIPSML